MVACKLNTDHENYTNEENKVKIITTGNEPLIFVWYNCGIIKQVEKQCDKNK